MYLSILSHFKFKNNRILKKLEYRGLWTLNEKGVQIEEGLCLDFISEIC